MENGFDQINKTAFDFVVQLEVQTGDMGQGQVPAEQEKREPMIGEGEPIMVLDKVYNFSTHQTDLDGNTLSKFADVKQASVGFHPERYREFKKFTERIYQQPVFKEKATQPFIEEHAFKWMVEVYEAKKAAQDLTSWLLEKIEAEYREYDFYFRLVPLMIRMPFALGAGQVTYLDETFLREQKEKFFRLPNKSQTEFDQMFSQYKDTALLKIRATGTEDRAMETATFEAELAIDVLKCFLYEYAIYEQYKIPDLETREKQKRTSSLLYNHAGDSFNIRFSFRSNGGVMPVSIDDKLLATFYKMGLKAVSDFVKHQRDDEVYYLTIETIRSLGDAVTTTHKHERVVKLVSLFEAVVIDERTKKGKGENNIKSKLLPKICQDERSVTAAAELVRYFYFRRDQFLHHGREEPIELDKLNRFTRLAFTFMLFMVHDGAKFHDLETFYNSLNDTPAKN